MAKIRTSDDAIKEVRTRMRGRTYHENSEPRIDELLLHRIDEQAAYIAELEKEMLDSGDYIRCVCCERVVHEDDVVPFTSDDGEDWNDVCNKCCREADKDRR